MSKPVAISDAVSSPSHKNLKEYDMYMYVHGGGLAGSVVSEECRDLSLVEIETQITDGVHLLASARQPGGVGLAEARDGDPQREMGGLVLKHFSCASLPLFLLHSRPTVPLQ